MHSRRLTTALIAALLLCAAWAQSKGERELFDAANRARKAQGLASLKWDDALATAARKHAEQMASHGSAGHQFPGEPSLPGRATKAGAHFLSLAENVDEGPTATAVHESFMKSPLHRANILDRDMDSVGIGIAIRNGQLFVVEDFSKAK
jgi:uncharacterized protein YkwD